MLTIEEIENINPDLKDMDRATAFDFYKSGNRNWFHGNGSPITSNAAKQAKLIRNEKKLVRRAKATILIWGYRDYNCGSGEVENVWNPFADALRNMGFSIEAIQLIKDFEPFDADVASALDELKGIYSDM